MKEYTVYKCKTCNRTFILLRSELKYTDKEAEYITCPYHGRHKHIIVIGAYESLKECMDNRAYKRVKGRVNQIK